MNKKILHVIVTMIVSILFAVIVGTVLMIAVYSIPISKIRSNVKKSVSIYSKENDEYFWAPEIKSTRLDNFTDSIIFNNATFIGTGSIINDAMNNPWVSYEDEPSKSMCLVRAVSENTLEGAIVNDYARYWHGYLIWLKPMLLFLNISEIRYLNMLIQFILCTMLLNELHKKYSTKISLPFMITILCINPISSALCIQYTSMYIITLVASLVMVKRKIYEKENFWMLFLWIGISSAFFDFLTYPVLAVGVNLLLMIALVNCTIKENIKKIIMSLFSWGIGYGGMWFGKWTVSYILTGNNTILEGIGSVKYRTDGDAFAEAGVDSTIGAVVNSNVKVMFSKPIVILLVVCVVIIVLYIIRKGYKWKVDRDKTGLMLIIGLLPFAWYAIVRNHSAIHPWMTHRNLAVSVMAIFIILLSGIRKPAIKKNEF